MVDENRIEGAARNMGGKVKEAFGSVTGDAKTEAGGKADQAAGTAQNAMGSAMDAAGDWQKTVVDFTKERPVAALLMAVSAGYVLRMMTRTSRR